jgi:hypothetical protein
LESNIGGKRCLATSTTRSGWPQRGVYFFFEQSETRSVSGAGLRVVRVGTHAITVGSKTKLWSRLSQHKGAADFSGNNRGSVFRLLVGSALSAKDPSFSVPTWGKGKYSPEVREAERSLEMAVSHYIGSMPFLWISVEDAPSPYSRRRYIERNSIALLSNAAPHVDSFSDPPSACWLGLLCPHPDVRRSGLWNCNHVQETYDPGFLDELERCAF